MESCDCPASPSSASAIRSAVARKEEKAGAPLGVGREQGLAGSQAVELFMEGGQVPRVDRILDECLLPGIIKGR